MVYVWGMIFFLSLMVAAAAGDTEDLRVFVGVMLSCLVLGGFAFYKFLKADRGQNCG